MPLPTNSWRPKPFTLELGKARPFGQNEQVNLDRLEQRLIQIIEGTEPEGEGSLDGLQLFSVAREIIKHSDSFHLHLPADIENFSELSKGYLLAEDLAETRWVVEEEGARIIFPNPRVKNWLARGDSHCAGFGAAAGLMAEVARVPAHHMGSLSSRCVPAGPVPFAARFR